MSSKSPTPTPRPGPASLEERRAQQRDAARIFREKQQKKGLYQTTVWVTLAQAGAVREWLHHGGDISVLRNGKGEHHG